MQRDGVDTKPDPMAYGGGLCLGMMDRYTGPARLDTAKEALTLNSSERYRECG
jgi:hypothetical protein